MQFASKRAVFQILLDKNQLYFCCFQQDNSHKPYLVISDKECNENTITVGKASHDFLSLALSLVEQIRKVFDDNLRIIFVSSS